MSLKDRLKKKHAPVKVVVVDGDTYHVRGLSLLDKENVFAKVRHKKTGELEKTRLDASFLAACVSDENGEVCSIDDWLGAASYITGPLMTVVLEVNGMDRDDVEGRLSDPKDCSDDQDCN